MRSFPGKALLRVGGRVGAAALRDPKATLQTIREIEFAFRGSGLVDAAGDLVSGDATRSAQAGQKIADFALDLQLRTTVSGAANAAVGVASQLFKPDVQAALGAVPHLGALAPLSRLSATRLDFVNLVLKALADFKDAFPGLGLGSSNIQAGGRKYSGLEVAQAWAILTNYGHLFATFETERGLLYHLDSEPALVEQLVRTMDPEGRETARRYLEERDLYHLYLALAVLRVSGWQAGPRRKAAIALLALLPGAAKERDTPLSRALWAFRLARRISYHRMHGLLGVGITFPPDKYKDILTSVRAPIGAQAAATDTVTPLLALLDKFHSEAFFASKPAAALILDHLREFKAWWKQSGTAPIEARVGNLYRKPDDWPKLASPDLRLVTRIRFRRAGVGWLGEVKEWLSRADPGVWEGSNFLLLPSHEDESMTCDVFAEKQTLPPRTTWFVSGLLADRVTASWAGPPSQAHSLWESVARFGATLLSPAIREGLRVTLSPVPAEEDHLGWALACRNLDKLVSRLNDFCTQVVDAGRKAELQALAVLLTEEARIAPNEAVWVVFLCRVFLHDAATGKEEAEIDGLALRVEPGGLSWIAAERKDGKRGTGAAQLEALSKNLRVPCGGPERGFSVSGNTTLLRFSLPAEAPVS